MFTTRSLSAPAAAVAAEGALTTTTSGRLAPPGSFSSFQPIVLTDDAAIAYDTDLAAMLPAVREGILTDGGRASILEQLVAKFGADKASSAQVITTGTHEVGSGIFVVGGNAVVKASGSGVLLAVGEAAVTARGNFDVYAAERVSVTGYDDVQIYATDEARIHGTWGRVRGVADGNVTGTIYDRSSWQLRGKGELDARDNSVVDCNASARVRAFGRARILASGNAHVLMYDHAQGWFTQNATGELWGSTMAQANDLDAVKVRGGEARAYRLLSARPSFDSLNWRSRSF